MVSVRVWERVMLVYLGFFDFLFLIIDVFWVFGSFRMFFVLGRRSREGWVYFFFG